MIKLNGWARGCPTAADRTDQSQARKQQGRTPRLRDGLVNPELRVIEVPTTVFAHHVKHPVQIHRQPFMLLIGERQGIARVRYQLEAVADISRPINIDNFSLLLAEDQKVAVLRGA